MNDGPNDSPVCFTLAPITRRNWQACIHLELAPGQHELLASNVYSLAESYVEPECQPRALCADGRLVGFVMFMYDEKDRCVWILRYMVDARHQGKGYGTRGMQAVLDQLRQDFPDTPIMISVTPRNHRARRLYLRLGFLETGRRVHGEDVLCSRSVPGPQEDTAATRG